MSGRKASLERRAPGRHDRRLRWTRVFTLAAALLIHLGFLVFLLAPPPGWRWAAAETPGASLDALIVHLLPPRSRPAEPPRPAMPRPQQLAHAASPARRPVPVARPTHATAQSMPPAAQSVPRRIDSLIATTPPSYVAGGGRLAGPDYGRQNVRVPGSSAPVRGMPVFRMADPRMQGVAGVVRALQAVVGVVDPHCLKLDVAGTMTTQERIANHMDDAQMAAIAAHYGCPDPLKPGAAMYYFYRQRRDVGEH
jgi:hypothetical protein